MCIYCIMVDDDVIYVGKTKRSLYKRWYEHKCNLDKFMSNTYDGS